MKTHNLVKLKAFLGIRYILEGNPYTCTKRHIYTYSSFICNRLKLESTPKSIKSRWKNKIWYVYAMELYTGRKTTTIHIMNDSHEKNFE